MAQRGNGGCKTAVDGWRKDNAHDRTTTRQQQRCNGHDCTRTTTRNGSTTANAHRHNDQGQIQRLHPGRGIHLEWTKCTTRRQRRQQRATQYNGSGMQSLRGRTQRTTHEGSRLDSWRTDNAHDMTTSAGAVVPQKNGKVAMVGGRTTPTTRRQHQQSALLTVGRFSMVDRRMRWLHEDGTDRLHSARRKC